MVAIVWSSGLELTISHCLHCSRTLFVVEVTVQDRAGLMHRPLPLTVIKSLTIRKAQVVVLAPM